MLYRNIDEYFTMGAVIKLLSTVTLVHTSFVAFHSLFHHFIMPSLYCRLGTVKALLSPGGAYLFFAVLEGGLLERGAYYKHEAKIYKTVLPGTYTTLCTSRRRLETLEEQLRKKTLTLKHMKLEIGSIKTKNIVNYC